MQAKLSKLKYFLFVFLTVITIAAIEFVKNEKIVQLDKQINKLKEPFTYLISIQYFFDLSMLEKNKTAKISLINKALGFLNNHKAQDIKNYLSNEIKKIKDNTDNPDIDSQNLYTLLKQHSKKHFYTLENSANNLKFYKFLLDKIIILFDIALVVFTILLIILLEYRKRKTALEEASYKDFLTNTYNRRKFFEVIHKLNPHKKHTVIMLDLDHFKRINDTYGHDVGDEVLKNISKIVKNNIRKNDYLFRWGGEEFIILLKETDLKGGIKVVEKIKNEIENSIIKNGVKVTASFGICETNYIDDKILQKLDYAMYESKRKGRNRITIAS